MVPNTENATQSIDQNPQAASGNSLTKVASLIKSAETSIKAGDFGLALQQLGVAQRLEPTNFYIRAIVERANELQQSASMKPAPQKNVSQRSTQTHGISQKPSQVHDDYKRHAKTQILAPVHDDSEPEYKTMEIASADEETPYFQDRQSRIKDLTDAAMRFLNAGSHEEAFDALMSAYLIDPTNRFVVECEKIILPALQLGPQ